MSYGNEIIRVCRLENGLEVEIYEPKLSKEKLAEKGARENACCPPFNHYDEPWKAYAFESDAAALAFITEKLPGLRRKSDKDEYNDAFNEVTKS